MVKLLQCNLLNSWRTQDLFEQNVIELSAGVCAVSEPRHIPDSPFWFSSTNRLAAIFWRTEGVPQACTLVKRAQDFVAVKCGDIKIVSCYISPNASRGNFLSFLDNLGELVRSSGGRTIICGDFNSKSTLWGSPATNPRGKSVEEWAAENASSYQHGRSIHLCLTTGIVDRGFYMVNSRHLCVCS